MKFGETIWNGFRYSDISVGTRSLNPILYFVVFDGTALGLPLQSKGISNSPTHFDPKSRLIWSV
jgi:hypothetical protein